MALSAKAGSFNIGTGAATTTVAVSGFGFQPKVVFLTWNGRTSGSDGAARGDQKFGFGAAISTTDRRFSCALAQDAAATMLTNKSQGNAACIGLTTTADAIDGLADVSSIDSDGITFVIDDQFAADYRIHYLGLGGTDITNVAGGDFAKRTSTGDQDITALAFQPDWVVLWTCNHNVIDNTVSADSGFYFGVFNATAMGHIGGGSNDNAATSQTIAYGTDAEVMSTAVANVNDLDSHATFVTMLSNGFRINWGTANAQAVRINYVAGKGGNIYVGNSLTQTDTTTGITVTAGFEVKGGMVFSHNHAESASDTFQDDHEISMGFFTSTSERVSVAIADDDAAADAIVSSATEHDQVYTNLNANTGAVEGLMDVSSISSTAVTFIMDDADPTQNWFGVLLFGSLNTQYNATLSGDLTPAGALLKTTTKPLAGGVDPAGAIVKTTTKAAAGTLTPSGELDDTVTKVLGGTLTPTGTLTKQTAKTFAGTLTPTGGLVNTKVALLFVSGDLTPAGALLKTTTHLLAGTLTPTGDLTKQTSKPLAGSLTPTGTLARSATKVLAGTLTPAGAIAKQTGKGLAGTLTPTGDVDNSTQKTLSGSLTPSGALAKTTTKPFAGTLTPAGALSNTRLTILTLTGSLTPTGTLTRAISKPLAGSLLPVGALARTTFKVLSGTLGLSGALVTATNVVFTPPASRTFSVPHEDRTFSVPIENRTYSVPSGDDE